MRDLGKSVEREAKLAFLGAENYSQGMSTVAQLEEAVFALPHEEFLSLLNRMNSRMAFSADAEFQYESPELEAELLKSADGPWQPMDEAFWASIRRSWPSNQKAALSPA